LTLLQHFAFITQFNAKEHNSRKFYPFQASFQEKFGNLKNVVPCLEKLGYANDNKGLLYFPPHQDSNISNIQNSLLWGLQKIEEKKKGQEKKGQEKKGQEKKEQEKKHVDDEDALEVILGKESDENYAQTLMEQELKRQASYERKTADDEKIARQFHEEEKKMLEEKKKENCG